MQAHKWCALWVWVCNGDTARSHPSPAPGSLWCALTKPVLCEDFHLTDKSLETLFYCIAYCTVVWPICYTFQRHAASLVVGCGSTLFNWVPWQDLDRTWRRWTWSGKSLSSKANLRLLTWIIHREFLSLLFRLCSHSQSNLQYDTETALHFAHCT